MYLSLNNLNRVAFLLILMSSILLTLTGCGGNIGTEVAPTTEAPAELALEASTTVSAPENNLASPEVISTDTVAPSGEYTVLLANGGDGNAIGIATVDGKVITPNLIEDNTEAIGYNTKFKC